MTNYIEIGSVRLPTAAYALSCHAKQKTIKDLLEQCETIIKEGGVSKHKVQRFKLEKSRFKRIMNKLEPEPEASYFAGIYAYFFGS